MRLTAITLLVALFFPASSLRAQAAPAVGRDVAGLHIVRVGSRGPLVVVLHGGPGASHDYLRPEWDRLSEWSRVVYYDQRGCGRSDKAERYSWQLHVADLARLLDRVAPHETVVLAGSSWGAWLALLFAAHYPHRVRGLVLSGLPPWPYPAVRFPEPELEPPPPPRRTPFQLSDSNVIRRRVRTPVPLWSARDVAVCGDVSDQVMGSLGDIPLRSLRVIRAPVLIIRGDQHEGLGDGAEEVANVLPHGRIETIRGTGHDPWFNQPEVFFAAVKEFAHEHKWSRTNRDWRSALTGGPRHLAGWIRRSCGLLQWHPSLTWCSAF